MNYNFTQIEKKWQEHWEQTKPYAAITGDSRPKSYLLVEFPYPSGQGLHVGHPRPYTAMDVVARKRRKEGQNVLFPMGYDAFGLPTENYAIQNKIHPAKVTEENIAKFRGQLKMLGFSFDWDREVDTTDPDYYKWTQWIFLQMFHKGLAYRAEIPVNWCTSCKCVLANEEVVDGGCERCGSEVVRKNKSQWMLKITEYAQRLLDDLNDVDYIERVKAQQRNWIGRSEGVDLTFATTQGDDISVYTTRADTLFGATYMVLSPEHPLLDTWMSALGNAQEVQAYQQEAAKKSDFERTELVKEKTGVRLDGVAAINPATGKEMPIFISDYVLITYGTGAIMAVPGHDERDWAFAQKFDVPIVEVVSGGDVTESAYTGDGTLVNSDFLNGLSVDAAKEKMAEWLIAKEIGEKKVNFKLRDWVFSRQRYWGEPIPIVHCVKCGHVALPESELPLLLPDVESYEPTDTGESPLAAMTDWINTVCPTCGGPAQRETDTMPQWAGSSWYYLRYMDTENQERLVGEDAIGYWHQVDWYNGGMEHTTLHLLYSRFWHKFLYDIGMVPTKEPYAKRTSHGMILAEGGEKMSKSKGNVVNPNDIVADFGADTFRLYIMFIGDFEKAAPWSSTAVKGCKRFLDRVWNLAVQPLENDEISEKNAALVHQTIKKVGEDIELLKFNTAIAALMTLCNQFYDTPPSRGDMHAFLHLLSPFAPQIVEELWQMQGFTGSAMAESWPLYDEAKLVASEQEIAVQISGKMRGTVMISTGAEEAEVLEIVKTDEKMQKYLSGMALVKVIYVKNKLINLILKPE